MTRFACAIYTRKSSEEGLEQEFNSLDAQREACEAFIKSQKHAGWIAARDHYDDGGLSGGTMERPALQRLLADIKAGRVHIVVVYKVDRLTRSLADFAKIVDVLDAASASFVSVTQQFNTTTSMGRLTLNMLLSFAQFEREIASERIRDKIAASKAKGMWMGGTVPLGYDVEDRKLVINAVEAETVRLIFKRYTELGSVTLLEAELKRLGYLSKVREGVSGRISGGRPFSRGNLYLILQIHVYRGEVAHKGNVYPGQHEAIVDADLWSLAQEKLAANRNAHSLAATAKVPSLLSGLIFDADGQRMTPTHANKKGRRYRYYISVPFLGRGSIGPNTMRVPAGEVEGLVLDQILQLLRSRQRLVEVWTPLGLNAAQLERAFHAAAKRAADLAGTNINRRRWVRQIVSRVVLAQDQIELSISTAGLASALGFPNADHSLPMLVLPIAAELRRCGKGKRMIIGEAMAETIDPALVRLIQEAFALREAVLADTRETLNEITARRGKSNGYLTALMRLTYLAPSIIDDILHGRQPPDLSAKRLLRTSASLPLDWSSQRTHLKFASAAGSRE
jgi:site-specific DNA recombinase